MIELEATVRGRSESSGAGLEDTRNRVAKTAQVRRNDNRDLAGETTDTIREYLVAIGQHPLLEQADEIRLGLAVERRMELKRLREDFSNEHGFQASAAMLAANIYSALRSRRLTLLIFAEVLGHELAESATISDALAITEVRDALDLPMDSDTKSAMAMALEAKEADAVARVAEISRLRWLLPADVINALDTDELLDESELEKRLDKFADEIEEWWKAIESAGKHAGEELTNSNFEVSCEHCSQVPESRFADA